MKKKLCIFSIVTAILLVLTCFPTNASQPIWLGGKNSVIETTRKMTGNSDTVLINVYHLKEDGTIDKAVKKLPVNEHETLIGELNQVERSGKTLKEIFEEKLQILKDYKLVSNDLTLEDILDVEKLTEPIETQQFEDFEAENAPIFLGGGGVGFGFGVPFLLTSGTFLCILIGGGLVLCYDFANKILHSLLTIFFIPLLVGVMQGFIGLLLLPVIPGFFYSNFFGLGMVAKTSWRLIPSTNISAV
ncbi:MAG: hypothetical protein KAI20_03095 [Thermoplasmatales archaeon]|nr:hypothetical protein [Thermoplasmatales archaeon]